MPRTIIAHAVCRKPWSAGLDVIAVTTRRRDGRIWGRQLSDDMPTNRAGRDVLALYKTQAAAVEAIERVSEARRPFAQQLADLDRQERTVRAQMGLAETDALDSAERLNP